MGTKGGPSPHSAAPARADQDMSEGLLYHMYNKFLCENELLGHNFFNPQVIWNKF